MSLTHEDVQKIARLARLHLTEEELDVYQTQLSSILEYIATLDELNLDQIDPHIQAGNLRNITRDDIIQPSLPTEDALFNAIETRDNQFFIQPILDE